MKKIVLNIVKRISISDIDIKKNYRLFRVFQKIINVPSLKNKNYEDFIFNLEDRNIKARVFYPPNDSNGVIIYIHGGGWVSGSIGSYTNICSEISNLTNRIVVSIDYRLAPEYPYPNGLNDCYEVTKMIMENIDNVGLKSQNVCLMGDSAGGNLAAAISIKSRRTKDFKVSKQILIYPSLQGDYSNKTKYKSVIEKGKDYFLTQTQLQDYMSLYVNDKKQLDDPLVSPLKVKFPIFYPQTLLITADNDPLRDEGIEYAKKLKLCFNRVEHCNLEGAMHGFLSNPLDKKNKEIAYTEIIRFLGDIDEDKR